MKIEHPLIGRRVECWYSEREYVEANDKDEYVTKSRTGLVVDTGLVEGRSWAILVLHDEGFLKTYPCNMCRVIGDAGDPYRAC